MGNIFQEQLLKAGLVNKKQAKKAKREEYLRQQQTKKPAVSVARAKAQEELAAKARKNRGLEKKRNDEKLKREKKAQIKQLIEQNCLALDEHGEAYHFVEGTKIQRVFVTGEIVEQLSTGQLAIVRFAEKYEVVPAKVARQIASRDQRAVISFHQR